MSPKEGICPRKREYVARTMIYNGISSICSIGAGQTKKISKKSFPRLIGGVETLPDIVLELEINKGPDL